MKYIYSVAIGMVVSFGLQAASSSDDEKPLVVHSGSSLGISARPFSHVLKDKMEEGVPAVLTWVQQREDNREPFRAQFRNQIRGVIASEASDIRRKYDITYRERNARYDLEKVTKILALLNHKRRIDSDEMDTLMPSIKNQGDVCDFEQTLLTREAISQAYYEKALEQLRQYKQDEEQKLRRLRSLTMLEDDASTLATISSIREILAAQGRREVVSECCIPTPRRIMIMCEGKYDEASDDSYDCPTPLVCCCLCPYIPLSFCFCPDEFDHGMCG